MKTLREYITDRRLLKTSEIQLERMGLLEDYGLQQLFNKWKSEATWHIEFLRKKSKTKPSNPLYPLKPNENLEII